MNQNSFSKLIAGKKRGFFCFLLRLLLLLASLPYRILIAFRNLFYNKGLLKSYSVNIPVISVGNITSGGTGKTPTVIWLCNHLREKNLNSVILTRGYKASKGKLTDEPAVLAKSCPDTQIVINPNRVQGAQNAISQFKPQVIIMDDGFQHRRLKRNLDIITIDATRPFGYGHLLPAGLLREPVSSVKRAHIVIITRTDQVNSEAIEKIEKKIKKANHQITIAKTIHKNTHAVLVGGDTLSLEQIREKKIFAFCGLGNPDAFLDQLRSLQLRLSGSKIYNDHHKYTPDDITDIYEQAKYLDAELVLTTSKDYVKTASLRKKGYDIPLAYLALKLDFIEGYDKIVQLIEQAAGLSGQQSFSDV